MHGRQSSNRTEILIKIEVSRVCMRFFVAIHGIFYVNVVVFVRQHENSIRLSRIEVLVK